MIGAARRLQRFETWLTLLALPPLVFREAFPGWLQIAGLTWLALLWLARRLASGRWSRRTVLDAPALALLATLPAAIAVAQVPQAGLSRAMSLVFAMALAYALANFMRGPRRAWLVATWLMLAGLALVALSLVSVDWLDKYAALAAYLSGLPRWVGAVPHPTLPDYGPAEGVGVHPNTVAGLLLLFLPLAAALLWRAGTPARPDDAHADPLAPPPWIRPLALALLVTGGLLLLLTQSRGAWLALAAALGLMVLARWRLAFLGVLGAGAVAGLGLLVMGPAPLLWVLAKLGLDVGASVEGRFRLWQESLELLAGRPLTGIGLGNFLIVHGQRPEYEGAFVYQGFPHAHNLLLQAALDFGLPGLVAVVGIHAALAWAAWRAYRRLAGTAGQALVLGLAFGLLAHALHGLGDAISIGSKAGFVPWAFAAALAGLRADVSRWSRS